MLIYRKELISAIIFFMSNHLIPEIASYLQHQDYSLAVRRLLDISLDIDKPVLLEKAITLSRYYHSAAAENKLSERAADFTAGQRGSCFKDLYQWEFQAKSRKF